MADLNTPAGQLGNAVGGVGGNLAKAADDIVQRQMIQSQLKEYFSQEQFWGTQPWFDDLKNGADFIFSKRDFDKGHQVIIKGKDQAHTLVTPKDHFNEWAKQGKNTAAAGTVAPSAARSSIPVAARSSVPIAASAGPAMEIKDNGDVLAAEIASKKGDALVKKTIEDKQEEVQEDLQESVEEKGAETVQDALLDKAKEKAEELAKDKTKKAVKETTGVKGEPKYAPKSGVRVRKASTTRLHHSNCNSNFFCW